MNLLFSNRFCIISSGLSLYSPGRASVTCVCMTGLNGIFNTLHIRIYIPLNKSESCQYERRRQLGDVMTVINAMMLISILSLFILTHPWMIRNFQYLLHKTSKFKISFRFETSKTVFHHTSKNYGCRDSLTANFAER